MFSFKKRKRQLEVAQVLRRIIDHTSPTRPSAWSDLRFEARSNRTIPVLITPIEDNVPNLSETCFAVTKDLSDSGTAVVLQQPFQADHALVGFWDDEQCVFAQGAVCYRAALEGGFWQLGILLSEIVNPTNSRDLQTFAELAERLRPATESDARAALADA